MLNKFKEFLLAILLGSPLCLSAAELEIRKITPPNLEEGHLGKKNIVPSTYEGRVS